MPQTKVLKSQLKTEKLGSELMELSQQCIFDRLCSLLAGKPTLQPRVLELIESGALEKKEDDSKSDCVPGCTPESKKCLQSESVIGFSSWFFESCTLQMTCVTLPMSRCINKYRLLDSSFLKDVLTTAKPEWCGWFDGVKGKKNLMSIFCLLTNISPNSALPSRKKLAIVEEVKQRVAQCQCWWKDVEPEGTVEDFLAKHGWFKLSENKTE